MSSTDTTTTYQVALFSEHASGGGPINNIAFEIISQGEFTDDMAFTLVDAWKNLSWPSGMTVDAQVQKYDDETTIYTTNYTATPPSFT